MPYGIRNLIPPVFGFSFSPVGAWLVRSHATKLCSGTPGSESPFIVVVFTTSSLKTTREQSPGRRFMKSNTQRPPPLPKRTGRSGMCFSPPGGAIPVKRQVSEVKGWGGI